MVWDRTEAVKTGREKKFSLPDDERFKQCGIGKVMEN